VQVMRPGYQDLNVIPGTKAYSNTVEQGAFIHRCPVYQAPYPFRYNYLVSASVGVKVLNVTTRIRGRRVATIAKGMGVMGLTSQRLLCVLLRVRSTHSLPTQLALQLTS
jgi:hypothetical protein